MQKATFQISLKKLLWLKRLKTLYRDLNGEEIVGTFYEKELQKANQKEFRIEKILKRKDDKLYVEWKGYNSFLIIGLIKKDIV